MAIASFRAKLLAGATILSLIGPAVVAEQAFAQDSNTQNTTNTQNSTTPAPDNNAQTTAPAAPDNNAQTTTPAPTGGTDSQAPAAEGDNTAAPAAPADPKEVVATLNGKPITRQDVIDSASSLPPQYQAQIDLLFPQLLNRLIGQELLVAKGRDEGLANDPDVKRYVQQAEDQAIIQIYLQKLVEKDVTDDAIKKVYDADLAAHPPQPEIRARHILVKTEDEAKDIIKQLQGGADFAKLAQAKSIDTQSGKDGGELGWFSKDTMVKEFSDAAFAMQRGEISKVPVKSQFGWHVIQVEDSRMQIPPTLDERKDDIRKALGQEAVHDEVQKLIGTAKVTYSKDDYKLPLAPTGQ